MNWFALPFSRISTSPLMPLSFRDAEYQIFHIDCHRENISIQIGAFADEPAGRLIFLWRRDTNSLHTLVIDQRFQFNPSGFMLMESMSGSKIRIHRGMTGGVVDKESELRSGA